MRFDVATKIKHNGKVFSIMFKKLELKFAFKYLKSPSFVEVIILFICLSL